MGNWIGDEPFVLAKDEYIQVHSFPFPSPLIAISCRMDSITLSTADPMRVVSSRIIGGGSESADHCPGWRRGPHQMRCPSAYYPSNSNRAGIPNNLRRWEASQ